MPRSALGILTVGLMGAAVGGVKIADAIEIAKTVLLALTLVMAMGLVVGRARHPSVL